MCALLLMLCLPSPALAQTNGSSTQTETRPLLMIVVGFAGDESGGALPYSNEYDWSSAAFGEQDSVASYYADMSGGRFSFAPAIESCSYDGVTVANVNERENDGVVHVVLDRSYHAWGLVNQDDDIARDFAQTVLAAFDKAEQYVDYDSYDANGNRSISPEELVVAIMVPGYDASTIQDPRRSDIPLMWSHAGVITQTERSDTDESIGLDSYIALTENLLIEDENGSITQQEPLGILYHELGHYLGLPDLYALNEQSQDDAWAQYKVGALSLMDGGGWAQELDGEGIWRYKPSALDAWSRYLLGWQMPQVATTSGNYLVSSQDSSEGYRTLLVPTRDPDQYFLVENRQPFGHDSSLAASYAEGPSTGGIVIWHIDKGIYRRYALNNQINNTDHRPGVMEVFFERDDNGNYVANGMGYPDVQAPFHSLDTQSAFLGGSPIDLPLYDTSANGADTPASRTASGISISVLTEPASSMTVHVEMPETAITQASTAYARNKEESSSEELDLLDIACAALLHETDAEVALVCTEDLLVDLPQGEITYDDAYATLAQDSPIALFNVTGQQLLELMESLAEQYAEQSHSPAENAPARANSAESDFIPVQGDAPTELNVCGISCSIDWNASQGERITFPMVGKKPLDPAQTYHVATTARTSRAYRLGDSWNRNNLLVFGSPADALRSFVQLDSWEARAKDAAETSTWLAPKPASTQAGGPTQASDPAQASDQVPNEESSLERLLHWVKYPFLIPVAFIALVFAGALAFAIDARSKR